MTTGSLAVNGVTISGAALIPAMMPDALCSFMVRPRTSAVRSSVAPSIAPAQCSAEISPRLCPTPTIADTPSRSIARSPAREPVTILGWAT